MQETDLRHIRPGAETYFIQLKKDERKILEKRKRIFLFFAKNKRKSKRESVYINMCSNF